MKVAVGLRRVAAGKRTSGRRAAQIAVIKNFLWYLQNAPWIPANVTKYLTDDGKSI